MIPKHLVTSWICSPDDDRYTPAHREMFARHVAGWLRLMPDYTLTVITLGNLYALGRDPWVEARVAEGNFVGAHHWASVRFLQAYGGVYLDYDMEVVRRFDPLLTHEFVAGSISLEKPRWANNGIFLSRPGHPLLQDWLDALPSYDTADPQFANATGPALLTKLLRQRGWSGRNAHEELEDVTVVPSEVLYPFSWKESFDRTSHVTANTVAVHHWGKSWFARAGLSA